MNVLLWVLQVLLALVFLAHGWLFLSPPPEVAVQMNQALPRWFSLFLGVAEVAASLGMILPGITRVQPLLVAWAATGAAIVVGSATVFHTVRGEYSSAAVTFVLFVLAAGLAYGRARLRPIRARGGA
jgi:putative oxidoreductase